MKTSIIIILLLAFSFAGNAQERDAAQKTYMFEYSSDLLGGGGFLGGLQWYQELALYIDGVQVQTFNIGNVGPTAVGFTVPLGSSWRLWSIRQHATSDGMHFMLPLSFQNMGTANNSDLEIIRISSDGML